MKPSLILHTAAVACLAFAVYAQGSTFGSFNTTAFENEGVIRFWLWRDGDTNVVESVNYVTKDLTAQAGVHYVARTGTVTFAISQTAVPVDVALMDNGLLDGPKSFELFVENPAPDVTIAQNNGWNCNPFWAGAIRDNELPPTRVDPLFVPDRGPGIDQASSGRFAAAMPDGRVLISGGSKGITMLQSNGWIDPAFRPGDNRASGPFDALHVFADGKILTMQSLMYPGQRFVRLLPNGAVDAVFPICTATLTNPKYSYGTGASQSTIAAANVPHDS